MKNANIWHDCYALTTTKYAYSVAFNSQIILSIEKGIKYTNRQTDLKMKSKLEHSDIKKIEDIELFTPNMFARIASLFQFAVRTSRVSIG